MTDEKTDRTKFMYQHLTSGFYHTQWKFNHKTLINIL